MKYWWECTASTAISPKSAHDITDQYHKTGGITFGTDRIASNALEQLPNSLKDCVLNYLNLVPASVSKGKYTSQGQNSIIKANAMRVI